MMKTLLPLLLVISCIGVASCEKLDICQDRDLKIEQQSYLGSRLRTDGYYYTPSDTDENGLILNELILFYNNGVMMLPGTASVGFEEAYIRSIGNYTKTRQSKPSWGTFKITDSMIQTAYWQTARCGYPSVLKTGEILNDTTFLIRTEDINGKHGTGTIDLQTIYRFRALSPKPDSTNDFIRR